MYCPLNLIKLRKKYTTAGNCRVVVLLIGYDVQI